MWKSQEGEVMRVHSWKIPVCVRFWADPSKTTVCVNVIGYSFFFLERYLNSLKCFILTLVLYFPGPMVQTGCHGCPEQRHIQLRVKAGQRISCLFNSWGSKKGFESICRLHCLLSISPAADVYSFLFFSLKKTHSSFRSSIVKNTPEGDRENVRSLKSGQRYASHCN